MILKKKSMQKKIVQSLKELENEKLKSELRPSFFRIGGWGSNLMIMLNKKDPRKSDFISFGF